MAEHGDLVIGLGNPLRGDDGIGGWLAERASQLAPAARVLAVQQLTPELAEELAGSARVLFIDAWLPWPTPEAPHPRCLAPHLQRLEPPGTTAGAEVEAAAFSHRLDPAQLLAITTLLHGRAPEAWQLLVPAFSMPHGEAFSSRLQRLLPAAEALLLRWCSGTLDGVSASAWRTERRHGGTATHA